MEVSRIKCNNSRMVSRISRTEWWKSRIQC